MRIMGTLLSVLEIAIFCGAVFILIAAYFPLDRDEEPKL